MAILKYQVAADYCRSSTSIFPQEEHPVGFEKIIGEHMGLCFGFMTNDTELLHCAMEPYKMVFRLPEGAPHGWGLGYYQAGQPLIRKQPKTMSGPLDFTTLTGNIKANLLLGHVRKATIGGLRTENTHPFRYRNWMFCHTGTINRFELIKEDMLRSMPDFIRRNIRGITDSEHFFHLFLSFLNDTGKIDDLRIPAEVASQALASTFAYVDRLVTDRGGTLAETCCIISNGSNLVATHRGQFLKVHRKTGFMCTSREMKPIPSSHLKAVLVLGGVDSNLPGWETVTERSIVTIDHDLNIQYSAPL
jgi:predicted glutamine amidotransferase